MTPSPSALAREIMEKFHDADAGSILCSPQLADEGDLMCPECDVLLVEITALLASALQETPDQLAVCRERCAKTAEACTACSECSGRIAHAIRTMKGD